VSIDLVLVDGWNDDIRLNSVHICIPEVKGNHGTTPVPRFADHMECRCTEMQASPQLSQRFDRLGFDAGFCHEPN
jgi:hypothetical protein